MGAEVKSLTYRAVKKQPLRWFVIIEGNRFDIFSQSSTHNELSLIYTFQQSDRRTETDRQLRDSPGRSYDSFSRSSGGHQTAAPRHSYSSHVSPKKRVSLNLLHQACFFLEQERRKDSFQQLAIFASPRDLGFLRTHLRPLTLRRVQFEVPRSLSYLTPKKKLKLLSAYLPFARFSEPRLLPLIHGS